MKRELKSNLRTWMACGAALGMLGNVALAGDEAANIVLPSVRPPAGFENETAYTGGLSQDQINDLLPWASNSEIELKDLQERVRGLDPSEKRAALVHGLAEILGASGSRQNELLMRAVVDRGLKFYWMIAQADSSAYALYVENRLLDAVVQTAMKYYQSDVETLQHPSHGKEIQYAKFGLESMGLGLNPAILNAQAQYKVAVTVLRLLEWDLYRDAQYQHICAPEIVKIDRFLAPSTGIAPEAGDNDTHSVVQLRQVREFYQQVRSEAVEAIAKNGDVSVKAAEPVAPVAPQKLRVGKMAFSQAGEIGGYKKCVNLQVARDPHFWYDNFLCFDEDYAFGWFVDTAPASLSCLKIDEPNDRDWGNVYLCGMPGKGPKEYGFAWSHQGKIPGMDCDGGNFYEQGEPLEHTWADNFLCKPMN